MFHAAVSRSQHLLKLLLKMHLLNWICFTIKIGVVVQEDLVHALKNGTIFSAGLDVMTPEPLPFDDVLARLPNCGKKRCSLPIPFPLFRNFHSISALHVLYSCDTTFRIGNYQNQRTNGRCCSPKRFKWHRWKTAHLFCILISLFLKYFYDFSSKNKFFFSQKLEWTTRCVCFQFVINNLIVALVLVPHLGTATLRTEGAMARIAALNVLNTLHGTDMVSAAFKLP